VTLRLFASYLHIATAIDIYLLHLPCMSTLPQDIIDEIVDVAAEDWELMTCLPTLALVSKAFAVKAQAHLFHSINIQDRDRCAGLLGILKRNPVLCFYIQRVTVSQEWNQRQPHTGSSMDHCIHSSEGGKLMDLLTNVRILALRGVKSNQLEINRLIHKSLHGRLQTVVELHLSFMDTIGLDCLAGLMLHFPLLETLMTSGNAMVQVHAGNRDYVPPNNWIEVCNNHGRCIHLRRLTIHVTRLDGARFPPWFCKSKYLSNIEELHLYASESDVSFNSCWDLVQNAASTLTNLTFAIPYVYADEEDSSRVLLNPEPLSAARLRTLEIKHNANTQSLFWISEILSAIDSSTPLHTIYLTDLSLPSVAPGAFEMFFWNQLDDIMSKWNDTLEKIVIHVDFDVYTNASGPQDPPSEADIRRAMVNANEHCILELFVRFRPCLEDESSYFGLFD
jgi:hypothetical protein